MDIFFRLFFSLLVLCCSFSIEAAAPSVIGFEQETKQRILSHVQYLSSELLQGRQPNTHGSKLAQDYISQLFAKHKLQKFGDSYSRPFDYQLGFSDKQGTNIAAIVNGTKYPELFIVFTAHYDHLGKVKHKTFYGADDNASGVGVMLGLAEYFSRAAPNYSLLFVATDAEELGLHGAKAFVEQSQHIKSKILLNVNLDMLGTKNRNKTLFVAGTRKNSHFKHAVNVVAEAINGNGFRLKRGHDGITMSKYQSQRINWNVASDHSAFRSAKIPYLFFSVDTHKHYHKPSDTYENLDKAFYLKSADAVLHITQLINQLSPGQFKAD